MSKEERQARSGARRAAMQARRDEMSTPEPPADTATEIRKLRRLIVGVAVVVGVIVAGAMIDEQQRRNERDRADCIASAVIAGRNPDRC